MPYIRRVITCRLPDAIKEALLYALVMKYQQHKQPCLGETQFYPAIKLSDTCRRKIRFPGHRVKVFCRFGFPREATSFKFNDIDESVFQEPGNPKRSYELDRTEDASLTNDYNPTLLFVWQANHDVRYVGKCRSLN